MSCCEYILPTCFARFSNNIENISFLLTENYKQNMILPTKYCLVNGKGFLIIDFGKEYFGGLRISFGYNKYSCDKPFLRIRFGESLMEACSEINVKGSSNDHSTRDMTVYMSAHSDMTWGSTGFRFARLDFLEDGEFQIENIFLEFRHEKRPQLVFESSNKKLDEIMEAALRTLWLNEQNGVFYEGAKRDQHIWAGDLYPELLAALYSFSSHENIKNSINFIIENYPTPVWYNGIPSYNAWFVLTILRYFELTGDVDNNYQKCVKDNLQMFKGLIEKDFQVDEELWGASFLDWSTWQKESRKIGIKLLFIYALQRIANSKYIDEEDQKFAGELLKEVNKSSLKVTDSKPVNALALLANELDKKQLLNQIKENGAKDYTAFLSCFILEALAKNNELEFGYQTMLAYFGGMIDIGGTTLFEEFDIDWLHNSCRLDEFPKDGQNDFHGDFGKDCFTGYRKSLCHAWSCGVIPFVIENFVGLKIKDGNIISFKPNLLDLDFINCSIPTSRGSIQVNLNKDKYDINLPDGFVLEGDKYEK